MGGILPLFGFLCFISFGFGFDFEMFTDFPSWARVGGLGLKVWFGFLVLFWFREFLGFWLSC